MKNIEGYAKVTTFVNDINEEPESHAWGWKIINFLKLTGADFKCTSIDGEVTIWVNGVNDVNGLLTKIRNHGK